MNTSKEITAKQKIIPRLISYGFSSFPPCPCPCITSHFTKPYINSCTLHMHVPNIQHWKRRTQSDSNNASLNPQAEITANTPHQRWQGILSKFSYSKSQWPYYTSSTPSHCNSTAVVLMTFYSIHTGPGGVQHTSSTNIDVRRLAMRYVLRNVSFRLFCWCVNVNLHKPRQYSIAYHTHRLYGMAYCSYAYKPVHHVTVLKTVSNCKTTVSIIIYYNLIGLLSYMWSVLNQNLIMRCMTVLKYHSCYQYTICELNYCQTQVLLPTYVN
jgi:hypothetical protein